MGWGCWAGPEIVQKGPNQDIIEKKLKQKIELERKQRRDGNIKHVILSEKRDKAFSKHLVKEVPFPYNINQ